MRQTGFSRGAVLAAALTLTFALSAAAQNEGPSQTLQLVKKSGRTVQAIADTKVQLTKTMEVYNELLDKDAKDRPRLYNKLKKEMAQTEALRAGIPARAAEMKQEADILFKDWAASAAEIESPELRRRSEQRLEKTKASYAEIGAVGREAAELYGPVLKTLRDHVSFLGHDLNAGAVKSLKPDAARLNASYKEVAWRIDDIVAATNKQIEALRPQ